MKARMYYFAGIIFLSLLFFQSFKTINSVVVNTENTGPEKKFLITALHSGFNPSDTCGEEFSSSGYALLKDTLHFNAWHKYGCWFDGDQVFGNPLIIEQGIINTISQNEQRDMATVFDRPITRYLAYGQRSDYQCENIPTGENYYFHAFETSVTNTYVSDITDNTAFGGGAKVKFCSLNASGPGVWQGNIVRSLRSNREQCNRIIDHTRDDTYNWYVKPRIRIDTAFANNLSNRNVKVCRIDIIDWNGDTVKQVDIRVKNFKQNNSTRYVGNYLDEYFFNQDGDTLNLILNPTDLCPATTPMKEFYNWDHDIGTDFRVYWYGECEMFLDYIRVENEPANKLFNVNNIDHDWLKNRLASEIHLAADASNSSPNNFYNEEFEFNMTPSTQELSKIIDSVSQGKISFMVNLNLNMYNVHIPRYDTEHRMKASEFKKYLLDSSKIKTVLVNAYNLEGWRLNENTGRKSYNPNTLPVYSIHPEWNTYDTTHGLLTYPMSPSQYDDWLQYNFDDNTTAYYLFTNINKIIDSISKFPNTNIDVMFLHQSHIWWQKNHKLKEPTNEELEMTANIELTYGSKGFMYFAYNGVCTGNGYQTDYTPTTGEIPMFSAGFVDKNKNVRDINAYGQNKWSFYKRYNRLLEKWGPYLVNFDNSKRSSYIYRKSEERTAMLSGGHFVNEIYTYRLQTDGSVSTTPEPINERFLQASFFDKYTHLDPPPDPPARYFIIVNRRGSPFIDSSSTDKIGGKRLIKMSIHPFSLWFKKYRNVSLQDLSDNSIDTTFYNEDNINYDMTLNLGWFNPGEAKLFRLSPALCVGGSLVADEEDIRNMEFTCDG